MLEDLRNPTDLMGWSCDPICWGTLLGGVWPSCHIRTALSAPTENTVFPSGDIQQSRTGALPSWLTVFFVFSDGRDFINNIIMLNERRFET